MQRSDSKCVLVVDDEPDVREFFCMALEDAGFQVRGASNGEEAWSRLEDGRVDLVTIDLVLPGEPGLALVRKLRASERHAQLPVVVVSAHARDTLGRRDFGELVRGGNLRAPDGYLEKPVDPVAYVRTVADLLGVALSAFYRPEADALRDELIGRIRQADLQTLHRFRSLLGS